MMMLILSVMAALTLPPVGDARNLELDDTVCAKYAAKWSAWNQVYRRYADWRGETVKLAGPPVKLAAEYRPGDAVDTATLRRDGYTGIVLLLDAADDPDAAKRTAMVARCAGLAVWIAYAPPREDHRATAYPEPWRLSRLLRITGAHADALMIGWRRTSVHLLKQDRAYTAHLIAAARVDNPRLVVVGELYAGETGERDYSAGDPARQIPPESGAVIAVNYVRPEIYPTAAAELLQAAFPGRVVLVATAANKRFVSAFSLAGLNDIIIIEKQGDAR